MGASRTLLRKGVAKVSPGKRIKPGTFRRRVIDVSRMDAQGRHAVIDPFRLYEMSYKDLGLEADYHFTKGLRIRKAWR